MSTEYTNANIARTASGKGRLNGLSLVEGATQAPIGAIAAQKVRGVGI